MNEPMTNADLAVALRRHAVHESGSKQEIMNEAARRLSLSITGSTDLAREDVENDQHTHINTLFAQRGRQARSGEAAARRVKLKALEERDPKLTAKQLGEMLGVKPRTIAADRAILRREAASEEGIE